jgi:hypothetical protein
VSGAGPTACHLYVNGVNPHPLPISPLPYMFSFEPDLTRPLRADPVRREEVLIDRWELATMPLGTFRLEERSHASITTPGTSWTDLWLVGDPVLWQPVLDEVAAEMTRQCQEIERWRRENPDLWGPPRVRSLPKPEFRHRSMREYRCDHCGCRHLGLERHPRNVRRVRVWVCSNRCERDRRSAQQRQWRKRFDYQSDNSARAFSRAAAREGLVCEHCGQPFEAARSTRRFCSDICRVKWHRRPQRAAAAEQAGGEYG